MDAEFFSFPPACGSDLRRIAFFQHHSDADLDRILPALRARNVKRGASLVLLRDLPQRVCFVWGGVFRLIAASAPQKTVTLRLLRAGDMFGQLSTGLGGDFGDRLRLSCDDAGILLEIGADRFAAFRREIPALAEATLSAISSLAADHGSRIFELSALNVRERVQAELLRLARHGGWTGRRCTLRPAPTHQALAAQVGATREVVTRALGALADEKLIRMDRGVIEFLDIDRLLALDQAATGRLMFDPAKYGSAEPVKRRHSGD